MMSLSTPLLAVCCADAGAVMPPTISAIALALTRNAARLFMLTPL
jgi:hypothetical protein